MGSTLALMIRRALPELSVMLIESKPFSPVQGQLPSFDERSTAISPTTVDVFKDLSLWQALSDCASPIENIDITDQGQPGRATLTPADNYGRPLGYVVRNGGMGHSLTSAVLESAVSVKAPSTVVNLTPNKSGVQIHLQDQQVVNTRLLIAADGAASPVRGLLGIGQSVYDYQQTAVVANVQFEKPLCSTAYERFTPQGPLALLPLGGQQSAHAAIVWTWPTDQLEAMQDFTQAQWQTELQNAFGYRLGRVKKMGERAFYPLSLSLAREQVRTAIVLMGNAAHFLHPVAGQGFNLAVRDALQLVAVLREAGDEFASLCQLQRYEQRQTRDQAHTIGLSHGFNQGFRAKKWGAPFLRTLGFGAFNALAPIKNQLILQLSGRATPKPLPW